MADGHVVHTGPAAELLDDEQRVVSLLGVGSTTDSTSHGDRPVHHADISRRSAR